MSQVVAMGGIYSLASDGRVTFAEHLMVKPLPKTQKRTIAAIPYPADPVEWLCMAFHVGSESEILFSVIAGEGVESALAVIEGSAPVQVLRDMGWVVCSPWRAGEEF